MLVRQGSEKEVIEAEEGDEVKIVWMKCTHVGPFWSIGAHFASVSFALDVLLRTLRHLFQVSCVIQNL